MKQFSLILSVLGALVFTVPVVSTYAASLDDRIDTAIQIVADRQHSNHPIPQALLNGAKGVAVIKVTKAGLVFGGTGGQGIVLVHTPSLFSSGWSAPSAFNVTGGSFGAQIGVETKRYILVINSDAALHLFTGESKVKWDASAAGTLGADAVKESESQLAELPIVVYSDSDGVFGGATFGGTTIDVDHDANEAAYGPGVPVHDVLSDKVKAPSLAKTLYALLNGKQ